MSSKKSTAAAKGKGKVDTSDIDHVAEMVKFVHERKVSRQVYDTLQAWLLEVAQRFNSELSRYGTAISEPEGETVEELAAWLGNAFDQTGKHTKNVSTLRNSLAVGAYIRANDDALSPTDNEKFRGLVNKALRVSGATGKHVRAIVASYPSTARLVEKGTIPLSVYQNMTKVNTEFAKKYDHDEIRVLLDSKVVQFAEEHNKAPNMTNMRELITEYKNPTDTTLHEIDQYRSAQRAAEKALSILKTPGATLEDIKLVGNRALVEDAIRDRLQAIRFTPDDSKGIVQTLQRYYLSWETWYNAVDMLKLREQLRMLYTLVENKIADNDKGNGHAPARNDDQWPSELDGRIISVLESSELLPMDVKAMTVNELVKVKGIGKASAERIVSAMS